MKKLIRIILSLVILLSMLMTSAFADNKVIATRTSSKVMVDGVEKAFDAYNINSNNYFKLRDIAFVLSNTSNRFEVTWNASKNAINLLSGRPYTVAGGELAISAGKTEVEAQLSTSKIYLEGKEISLTAYNIGGNNYFKLRDIGNALDFNVDWDGVNNAILIKTTTGNKKNNVSLLPAYKDENWAAYTYLTPNDITGTTFTFYSKQEIGPRLTLSCDVMFPKEIVNYLKRGQDITIPKCVIEVFDNKSNELNRTCIDGSAKIYFQNDNLYIMNNSTGQIQAGEDCGNYYRFTMQYDFSYAMETKVESNKMNMRIAVKSNDYAGTIYLDNIKIYTQSKTYISCDFNKRFGERGNENFQFYSFNAENEKRGLWGSVKKIGQEGNWNVLRSGIIFDGKAYEPSSEKYLNGIDPSLLHNREHDWRNWLGLSVWWNNGYNLPQKLCGYVNVIIPKETMDGFISQNSNLNFNVSFVLNRGNQEQSSNIQNEDFIVVNIRKDKEGRLLLDSSRGTANLTEYADSWILSLSGELNVNQKYADLISMQIKTTASEVAYNGYWYYDNLYFTDGKAIIEKFSSDRKLPYDFYNHGTNGSYYFWNNIGSDIYHFGFDTIDFER